MILKIRCADNVGQALLLILTAGYTPGELTFETIDDSHERTGGGGPRTQYWAKLPKLSDGAFDMAAVAVTVRTNLEALGTHTVNGIVYQDITDKTLRGEIATEPGIRAERMMKAGSSQRAVQQLYHNGFIDRGPIQDSASGS